MLTMFVFNCHACGFETKCLRPRVHSLKDFFDDGGCGCWEHAVQNDTSRRHKWNYHCSDICNDNCHFCQDEIDVLKFLDL